MGESWVQVIQAAPLLRCCWCWCWCWCCIYKTSRRPPPERASRGIAGYSPAQLIYFDDGGTGDTQARLLAQHREDPHVVVIDLSRTFGKEAALTAGLDHARGDCAIPVVRGAMDQLTDLGHHQ